MTIKIIHPPKYFKSTSPCTVFLAGPTPRRQGVHSWREDAINLFKENNFAGTILSPEPENGKWEHDYSSQINWELDHLKSANVVMFWVPRDLDALPGFTTNVEFGMIISRSYKNMLYGRPDNSPKNKYLDALYKIKMMATPLNNLEDLVKETINYVKNSLAVCDSVETAIIKFFEREEVNFCASLSEVKFLILAETTKFADLEIKTALLSLLDANKLIMTSSGVKLNYEKTIQDIIT